MSIADFLVGQIARETDFSPMSFNLNHQFLAGSPQPYMQDYEGSGLALPYPFSELPGLSGERKHHGVLFENQLGGTEGDLYSFDIGHQCPPTALDPEIDTASSTLNFNSQMPPSSVFSLQPILHEPKKTATTRQNPCSEQPAKAAPMNRRQARCKATKANNNQTKELKETKTKNRRKGTLERNRVAASKCRRHKKQWIENLEEKKSRLEAIHNDLQAEYMNLLQESSQLKNLVISHASCQYSNIDNWIKNEASKYVRNLYNPQGMNNLCPLPNLDENEPYVRHSTNTSPVTDSQESPDLENKDLKANEFSDEEDGFEDNVED